MGWAKRRGMLVGMLGLLLAGCASSTPVARDTAPIPTDTYTYTPAADPTPDPPEPARPVVQQASVTRVIDGDTIEVRFGGDLERVRLMGVDTPERGDDFYSEASAFTAQWAGRGTKVFLETDVEERDRYGRLLAYVWLERPSANPSRSEILGRMVNAKLLYQGFAVLLTISPNVGYVDFFTGFQADAKKAGKRLWEPPPAPKKTTGGGGSNCHPNYSGACLDPDASDYDCAGGSGNGPKYVEGPVYVEGDDPYRLDSDGDGVGCEP